MRFLRRWLLVMLAIVMLASPPRSGSRTAPTTVGGFSVLQVDLHVHSFLGDGLFSPIGLLFEARRRGLDAFALTNHNQVVVARLGRRLSEALEMPRILAGQEITAPTHHIIGVGLTETVSWRQSARAIIDDVHAQGGVAIAAHPVSGFEEGFPDEALRLLDGSERMHPLVFSDPGEAEELAEFYERARLLKPSLAAIGSSDFHGATSLGRCRTLVFVTEVSEAGILDALRDGRTVVHDEDGTPHGDPEMVALLNGGRPEPIEDRRSLAGLAGWLLLIAAVVVGRSD